MQMRSDNAACKFVKLVIVKLICLFHYFSSVIIPLLQITEPVREMYPLMKSMKMIMKIASPINKEFAQRKGVLVSCFYCEIICDDKGSLLLVLSQTQIRV